MSSKIIANETIESAKNAISKAVEKAHTAGYEKGYKTGETAEYNSFWDNAFQNGKREYFAYAFGSIFNDDNFKPNRKIIPKSTVACATCEYYNNGACSKYGTAAAQLNKAAAQGMFQGSRMTNLDSELIDWVCVPEMVSVFSSSAIREIIGINAKNCTIMIDAFKWCKARKIEFKNYSKVKNWSNAFYRCTSLEDVSFAENCDDSGNRTEFIIANIDFGDCTKLNKASITSVMNALSGNVYNRTVTLSLEAVNKAFESAAGANDGSTTYSWLKVSRNNPYWKVALR